MERDTRHHRIPLKERVTNSALSVSFAVASVTAPLAIRPSCEQQIASSNIAEEVAPRAMGATFSSQAAEWYGMEPLPSLEQMLRMGYTHIRLSTYMNQPTEEMLAELDAQIDLVSEYGGTVILAVGGKAPHHPEWYIDPDADEEEIEKAFAAIDAFGNRTTVKYFQLSNEPFLSGITTPPEQEHVLDAIHGKMREYNKPIIVTHLMRNIDLSFWNGIDLEGIDEEGFRQAAKYADIIGLDDYSQISVMRESCEGHVQLYERYEALAEEMGVELWITESQTQPWPVGFPFPQQFIKKFQPGEIQQLYLMQNIYLQPEVIMDWDVLAAIHQAENGDLRTIKILEEKISTQQETHAHIQRTLAEEGILVDFKRGVGPSPQILIE